MGQSGVGQKIIPFNAFPTHNPSMSDAWQSHCANLVQEVLDDVFALDQIDALQPLVC